ncbi:hypothetical protein WDU94_010602 [Cyamophila willieti]
MSTSTGQTTQTMTNMSINYVDKYVQGRSRNEINRKNETLPANMNENHHQIQHKLILQNRSPETQEQNRSNIAKKTVTNRYKTVHGKNTSEGTVASNTHYKKEKQKDVKVNQTGNDKPKLNLACEYPGSNVPSHLIGEETTRHTDLKTSPTFDYNKDHIEKPNDCENVHSNEVDKNETNNKQHLTRNETNKQHLTNNELLFRRIMNMFNKSQLWTTLRYGRSNSGRKRGRFFRKKYKNGYSENLLNSNEVNEVYRSDSFKFERFPKSDCNGMDGRRAVTEVVPGGRAGVYTGLSSAFHKLTKTDLLLLRPGYQH